MMILGEILRRNARPELFGNKTALIYSDRSWTYAELNTDVNRLANALLGLGVKPGDRVAVLGRNSDLYVVIYFVLAKLGAIMVPVNFWYKAQEIRYTLEQSKSSLFLVEGEFAETVAPLADELRGTLFIFFGAEGGPSLTLEELMAKAKATEPRVPLREDDPHIILYTSGTTGFPKGAVFSHRNHYLNALAWALQARTVEEDVGVIIYPLFHTGGPDCILLPHFLVGATVVILRRPEPEEILEVTDRWKVTNLFCVPTVWRRLLLALEHGRYNISSVRRYLGSSDIFPEDLLDAILGRFQGEVYVTYGLTEAGPIITFNRLTREDRRKLHSVGKPHPLIEARIVDGGGRDVKPGEVGEVVARGPTVMKGYWRMPDQTAEALRGGWLHSGDLARYDDEGFIYIAGRSKDMIISGGENIYPVEIEKLLRQHKKVKDVAVIGVPDREWGESVLAVVVPQDGEQPRPEEIIEYVQVHLAGYKKPRYVEFVEALPVTTATGKVQKAVLREIYAKKYAR